MSGLTSMILKAAAPLPRMESFHRYLFIGPHPDDIEIGAGASAARLVREGKQVSFLICLDGRFGDGNSGGIRGEELVAARKKEAEASAKMLGVDDLHFLELSDGGFYSTNELVRGIAKAVGELRPEVVFAPDPFSRNECHIDHLNVGNAARQVACFALFPGIMERYGADPADVRGIAFYMTAEWNRFMRTSGELLKLQLDSVFKCHKSQFPEGSKEAADIATYLKLRSVTAGLHCGCLHAEGFRFLDQTHMHCLPET